jgi:very-short-patch-repair endonuclease
MLLRAFARNMRAAQTDAEAALWRHLRAHRLAGHKFKRQQPIGKYIVDFVCFEAKCIVEVDGGQHSESAADQLRDAWLKSQGFSVLRFWNNDVIGSLDGVLLRIFDHVSPSPSIPPPPGGREARRSIAIEKSTRAASLSPRGRETEGEGV